MPRHPAEGITGTRHMHLFVRTKTQTLHEALLQDYITSHGMLLRNQTITIFHKPQILVDPNKFKNKNYYVRDSVVLQG
jgi:hypothetical protein